MQINEALYAAIKEATHAACEDDDLVVSSRAFSLLALFDAVEGVSDGSLTAEDIVSEIVGRTGDDDSEMVECIECGEQVQDPGAGVSCEAELDDGSRCGGTLEKVHE